ncbi:opsin 9 [Perca flavescens]|uniref:opsin 9 n=1 Tax=Perca flavescens TaxID=8167 RepID=UPI00106DF15A|nr:opsin-5-like [Perca flavescens]
MGDSGSQRGSWFVPCFVPSSIHTLFLSQLSPSAEAVAVFYLSPGVASVLGNGTVLLVYCRKRKKLRPPELMTINLALCDLGFSLLGGPFFIISSLCHAWVFGETGCLWYGIQGFVFGIGSLLTTCLISLDRCLKICCLRYGQWIERRHVYLSIALVWVYTLFWALLPAFGFGSYGPEPYGTSCTINWWKMRLSLNERIYIFLILVLCFGFPALTIVASYVAILLKVYRSNHTLASISFSSVSHTSKNLTLTKMAAVVCTTFFLAWMPYATVSLISALISRDDPEASLQTVVEESTGMASSSPNASKILDIPSLFRWTATEYYRQIYHNSESKWSDVNNMNPASITGLSDAMLRSTLDKEAIPVTRSPQPFSCLPPVVTLIPALFAKSHIMVNPLIYQIMNREFRHDVYVMVFGQEKGESASTTASSFLVFYVEIENRNLKKENNRGNRSGGRGTNSWADNNSVGADALDFSSFDTQGNRQRHGNISRRIDG